MGGSTCYCRGASLSWHSHTFALFFFRYCTDGAQKCVIPWLSMLWSVTSSYRLWTGWKRRRIHESRNSAALYDTDSGLKLSAKSQCTDLLLTSAWHNVELIVHPLNLQAGFKSFSSHCIEIMGLRDETWNNVILFLLTVPERLPTLSMLYHPIGPHLSQTQQHPRVGTVSCCFVTWQMNKTWKCRLHTSVHVFVFKYNFAVYSVCKMYLK